MTQRCLCLLALLIAISICAWGQDRHDASGMLVKVDAASKTIVVSCREIPGYMEAMEMPLFVEDGRQIASLHAGQTVEFVLVDKKGKPFAENIQVREFESPELDPTAARRLKGVETAVAGKNTHKAAAVGDAIPDFTLRDEQNRATKLSQFAGKVVAVTFMYTRCPFPTYCIRLSDNFARLQKRFRPQIGKDLILLNVVIDTGHDQPETLADYAKRWHADPAGWHFLTGSLEDVQKVCSYFDMNYYPDEGLYIHSFHTAVLDRHGKLVANLEGNQFTAQQLGDLVADVLQRPSSK